jgi:hypothetical protein
MEQVVGFTMRHAEDVGWLSMSADYAARGAGRVMQFTGIPFMDNRMRAFAQIAKEAHLHDLIRAWKSGNSGAARTLVKEGFDLGARNLAQEARYVSVEFANRVNLKYDVLYSPLFTATPWGSFMRGLQMFNINMTRRLFDEFLLAPLTAARQRNLFEFLHGVTKSLKFMGFTGAVGSLETITLDALLARKRDRTTLSFLAEAWATAGTFGLFEGMVRGMFDRYGRLVHGGDVPATTARLWEELVTGFWQGVGIGTAAELPVEMLDPNRRWRRVPILGPLLYELARQGQLPGTVAR